MIILKVNYTKKHCYVFPKKLKYILAGYEPGSSVPEADAMSTAPRRQGMKVFHKFQLICTT
jgi:hypothetical protein